MTEGGSVRTASTSVTVLALPNVITSVTVVPAALRTGLVLLVNMVRKRGQENYHYIFFNIVSSHTFVVALFVVPVFLFSCCLYFV